MEMVSQRRGGGSDSRSLILTFASFAWRSQQVSATLLLPMRRVADEKTELPV